MLSLTPLKAIRKHCLDCAGRPGEVRKCQTDGCFLFIYRMGKNPARSGIGPGTKLLKGSSRTKNVHST